MADGENGWSMNRDSRIAAARKFALDRRPAREAEQRKVRTDLQRAVARMSPDRAQQLVDKAEAKVSTPRLKRTTNPIDWKKAVDIARRVTVDAARRGETISDGEIRVAALQATGKLVDSGTFATLAAAVNRKAEAVLLSSIIVSRGTGKPAAGFTQFARGRGFDEPLSALQQQVFDHFAR